MLAQHVLEDSSRRSPSKTALVSNDQRLTYAEIDRSANRLARALQRHGLRRGDRVAIFLNPGACAVIGLFAALKAGGAFIVVHPTTKPHKLAEIFADAEPRVLITDAAHVRESLAVLDSASRPELVVWTDDAVGAEVPVQRHLAWSDAQLESPEPPRCCATPDDLAALIYTSGTTGKAKAVMLSHANMRAATCSVTRYLELTDSDVILSGLPLAFSYGLYQVFEAFQVGGRLVLEDGYAFPARTLQLMRAESVTGVPGVPTVFALLLRQPKLLEREFPTLRYLTNAGGPLPVKHLQQVRQYFPGVKFFSMYGQTECKRISYLPPDELDRRPASVGIAIPETEVYIVDETGRRVAPGQTGELVVRGPHVGMGYWRAPELTARRFRTGPQGERVLYTGDLFKADEDGFLYFVSRSDDIIKTRGEKVSPLEVENVVCHLEPVSEAAVVGAPDEILGQAVRLVIVRKPGSQLSEREVRTHCARHLESFKQPKYVEFAPELPRTANGKVDKVRIAADFATAPR